jgi:predicted RNase H-like nuclease (RuvC/YqgF family)
MISSNIDLVVKLEEKVDRLVGRYQTEKEENRMLRGQISQLTRQLEDASSSFVSLEERFNNLKISKSLEASSEDVHETKVRINQIVREIDKCIALLNR